MAGFRRIAALPRLRGPSTKSLEIQGLDSSTVTRPTDQCGRQAAACHPGSSARQIRSGRLHACFHTASATASRSSVPSGKAVQKYAILENRKARGQGRIRPTLPLRMPVRAVQTSAVPGFVPALDTCRLRKSVKEGGPKASFPKEHPSLKCVPSRILCRKTIFQATLGLAGSRAEPEFLDRYPSCDTERITCAFALSITDVSSRAK